MTDQFLQVCPNTTVSLTCSHDGVDLTRWRVTPPLPMDCDTVITHTASPNSEGLCGSFTVSMISSRTEQTRRSTIELLITESLDGAVVTCFAGASSTPDLQVRNLTIQINIGEVAACTRACMYKHSNCVYMQSVINTVYTINFLFAFNYSI